MNRLRKYSHIGLVAALTVGVALALLLSVQCLRTYLYVDRVLVPQQAQAEAERQGGELVSVARTKGVTEVAALGPTLEHIVASSSGQVIWMRILDADGAVLVQAGQPQLHPQIPANWWRRIEKHEPVSRSVETPTGRAFVIILPFRMPRPPRTGRPESNGRPIDRRGGALILELALPLDSVSNSFRELRHNLISGIAASFALLTAITIIGLRTPHHLRGLYLEKELQLAKRVQSDLLPKPAFAAPHVEFAAAAIAADHVGGDFHDIFEADGGLVLLLGDVSGKGMSAALLGSVIQGAIRSSSGVEHETSCERINRMLCEKTASERFATLFWGVFHSASATLRYVNAGHGAPFLLRASSINSAQRLDSGGPVLGILPTARYLPGVIRVEAGDTIVLYSDGINEAANTRGEEFGDHRVLALASQNATRSVNQICTEIMTQVEMFAAPGSAQDDRTLMIVRFAPSPH